MSMFPLVRPLSMISVEPMLFFSFTVKPLASSACLYSWPSTNCSVKFFAPSVSAGFPAPGLPAGAAVVLALVLLFEPPLPHAATASASAVASTPAAPRLICRTFTLSPFRLGRLCRLGRGACGLILRRRPQKFRVAAQSTRGDEVLHSGQEPVGAERQDGDHDRGAHHAVEAVAGLVGDDVAEPAAAEEAGERGGGHHVDGGRADTGEGEWVGQRELHLHEQLGGF